MGNVTKWSRPGLADFTEKPWEQLSAAERHSVAAHFAWAPAAAATFGDLKLPYKGPDGKVNLDAVRNALSRLPQTQGIPGGEKAKIKAMLQGVLARAQKDMGDVHVPTAIGTSLAQYRRRPRTQRLKSALAQLEAAPLAALGYLLPDEVPLAAGFVVADAMDVRKGADLALTLAAPYTGQHFMLRGAPTWLAIQKAIEASGATVRFRSRAADPVPLYDLVLKRALPPAEDPDEDEDLDEEAAEHDEEGGTTGFRILAKSAAEQKVTGVVLEPNAVDTQNDFVSPEEIEAACHQFGADYRARKTHLGYNHQRMVKDDEAVMVENYCLPAPATIGGQALPAGTWCQVWKIGSPAMWKEVEDGDLTGFSFGGSGLRRRANQPAALPK